MMMKNSRRTFIKQSTLAGSGLLLSKVVWSASSYKRIIGANDRVRVGVVGFSDRHKSAHMPSFMNHYKELNFDVVAVSDIWNRRREEGMAAWKGKSSVNLVPVPSKSSSHSAGTNCGIFWHAQ